jgi:3-deoxy-D-manno-oct-2-ulosonic acid (Kdo) hydroxylase
MHLLHLLPHTHWSPSTTFEASASTTRVLENSKVLYLPDLRFELFSSELSLLTPRCADGKAKNISLDPHTGQIKHSSLLGEDKHALGQVMARFARDAHALVAGLFPAYAKHLRLGMTSYRPVEVCNRSSSLRKNDRLLHVDAFVSRPTGGDRILRVFCNIHPYGLARTWRLGLIPFADVARHFLPHMTEPSRFGSWLLQALGVTRGRRTPYDHFMLQLHNLCKEDAYYQFNCPSQAVEFPSGSTWIAFTDTTSHAVVSGQFLLEQTFYLPVAAMQNPRLSPLHILTELTGRPLVEPFAPAPAPQPRI